MTPARQRIAVAHRIFVANGRRAHERLDVDARRDEAARVGDDLLHAADARPAIDGNRGHVAVGDADHDRPVGEARLGLRSLGDGVERELRAHAAADIHRAAREELRPFRRATP